MNSIDGLSRLVFTGAIGKPKLLTRKIMNMTDVKQAVYEVYKSPSIIARRMSGRANINVYPILDQISCKIFSYFNATPNTALTQTNYDEFLYDLCEYFKDEYNKQAIIAKIKMIEFGIAQKLINMVLKYLSCYEDYNVFADLFMYCHMPIDSYVLHYFNHRGIVSKIKSRFSSSSRSPSAWFCGTTWSNLSEGEYKELVTEYSTNLAISYPDYTSLHEEYYIWSMVKSRTIGPIIFVPSSLLPGLKTSFHR